MMKNNTILIVDDMEINRVLLHELFGSEHNIIEAENGEEAMDIIYKQRDQINLVLLDIMMPKKDGYGVLHDMQQEGLIGKIPVIVITAIDSMQSEIKALEHGASDLILKPFNPRVVKARVESTLNSFQYKKQMESTIQAQKKFINQSYMAMIDTLKMIVVHRNMESGQHIQRIQKYTKILLTEVAEQVPKYNLNKKYINIISKAAMLHDVGKIVIPDNILNKPGKLTSEEFEIMKSHSEEGCKILYGLNQMGNREFLQCAYDICRHHHERYDGRGYPDGLNGDEIALSAQVVGIADAYDALVNERIYKPAFDHEVAVGMILNGECGTFSSEILKCFENVTDKFKITLERYRDHVMEVDDDLLLNNLVGFLSEDTNELNLQTDSYKYFALLQYLNSTVFEVDLKTGEYKRVYPTYSEFSQLKPEGNFERDFVKFLHHSVSESQKEEVIQWTHNSWKQLERHENQCISKEYEVFNQIYQNYKWYLISFMLIEGDAEMNERFLVIFKRVEDKNETQDESRTQGKAGVESKEKMERDSLTGVYTNESVQIISKSMIEQYSTRQHGFLIINIDNFNYMNNMEGRLYGDEILCRFAQILKVEFCEDCVIGRLQGDEFTVFISNISGRDFLEWRIKKLMNEINSILRNEDGPQITVSIGASIYPKDGQELKVLYLKAEKALATAKNFGKKQYRIYSAKIEEHVTNIAENYKLTDTSRKLSMCSDFNNRLTSYFLSRQEEEFIPVVLDMAARYYSLSHLIVIETNQQEVLYQWNANAVHNLELLGSELVNDMMKENKLFTGEEGELFCSDVTKLKKEYADLLLNFGMTACIIIPIVYKDDKENSTMFVLAYDRGVHQWSEEEIESGRTIAKMIRRVLQQKYVEEKLERSRQFNQLIFQSNHAVGYAVDGAYRIIELSKAMEEKYNAQIGHKCYSEFYKLDTPCMDCPIKKLTKVSTETQTEKIIPDSQQKVKVKATAFSMGKTETVYLLMKV